MSDFGDTKHPKARQEYRCEWCYGPIPQGENHTQFTGMWDGDWKNWRMHDECYDAYVANHEPSDGFTPGEGGMPEWMKSLARLVEQRIV